MNLLSVDFFKMLHTIGMDGLKHPVFYNTPVGIRFEIGGNEGIYLDGAGSGKLSVNPAYITAAFNRAKTIYINLPNTPNLLRIDGYLGESSVQEEIQSICKVAGMPQPHEHTLQPHQLDKDCEVKLQLQLYWDLKKMSFSPDRLLREIIKADIGGYSGLVSNVYFANTHDFVLFHLYDDRGADLMAADRELLRPIYERFNSWILDYDRERINETFAK